MLGANDSEIVGLAIDREMKRKNRRRTIAEAGKEAQFVHGFVSAFINEPLNKDSLKWPDVSSLFKTRSHFLKYCE